MAAKVSHVRRKPISRTMFTKLSFEQISPNKILCPILSRATVAGGRTSHVGGVIV